MRSYSAPILLCSLLAGVLSAHPALAVPGPIPAPGNCTIPLVVPLVGTDGVGTPDPRGEFKVVVRNPFNVPIANSLVILQFSQCPAVRLASGGDPAGITVDCRPDRMTVRRLTNAQGEAVFRILGTARLGTGQYNQCVTVSADGVTLGTISTSVADLNGADGVGIADLSLWLTAFSIGDASLADYDGDHVVGINDLSVWLETFGAGGSLVTPHILCP